MSEASAGSWVREVGVCTEAKGVTGAAAVALKLDLSRLVGARGPFSLSLASLAGPVLKRAGPVFELGLALHPVPPPGGTAIIRLGTPRTSGSTAATARFIPLYPPRAVVDLVSMWFIGHSSAMNFPRTSRERVFQHLFSSRRHILFVGITTEQCSNVLNSGQS